MTIEVKSLAISGPLIITPKRFGDARGFFSETYSARDLAAHGLHPVFVQDNHSASAEPGTVRGLHFQRPPHAQTKLMRVARGAVLDIALDIRTGSATYGRHVAVELTAANWRQLYIPAGFAHGFCTLEPDTEVIYKVTDFYAPDSETGILWNDPTLGIAWPKFAGAQVSDRDTRLPPLARTQSPFVIDSGGS